MTMAKAPSLAAAEQHSVLRIPQAYSLRSLHFSVRSAAGEVFWYQPLSSILGSGLSGRNADGERTLLSLS